MTLMKTALLAASLAVTATAVGRDVVSAQGVPPGQRPLAPRAAQRRDALEAQILNKFVNRASQEMSLDQAQRAKLADVVHASAGRRKALNQRTLEMHRRIMDALRNAGTSQDAFTQLLASHRQLRREEQDIAETEQQELQRFLNARQQAQFLMMWIRLQENARQIQAQSAGPGGRQQ